MPAVGLNLVHIKQSLDSLSADVEQGIYHASLLRDLKLSVDQLRLTLWAIISYEDQATKEARGAAFGLGEKLADFRIKRLLQILSALQEDFQKGNIPPSDPDLMPLSSALEGALESISKLAGKKG
jgi:hypothetical protein